MQQTIPGTVFIRRTLRNNDEDLLELMTFDGHDYGVGPYDAPSPLTFAVQHGPDGQLDSESRELVSRAQSLLGARADIVDGELQSVEAAVIDLRPVYLARVREAHEIANRARNAVLREIRTLSEAGW